MIKCFSIDPRINGEYHVVDYDTKLTVFKAGNFEDAKRWIDTLRENKQRNKR